MSISKNSNLIASVCRIGVVEVKNVAAISDTVNRFEKTIAFVGDALFTDIYFTPGTGEFIEKPKETDAGTLYEQVLRFQFPGEDVANIAAFDQWLERPLIVALELEPGTMYKKIGDIDNPAKMVQSSQISAKGTGSSFEITCLSAQKATWLLAI